MRIDNYQNGEAQHLDQIDAHITKSNRYHNRARRWVGASVLCGHKAGKELLEIKKKVRSSGGKWLEWWEANKHRFEYSYRTATLYMKLGDDKNLQRVAHLPLREAAVALRKWNGYTIIRRGLRST